MNGNYFQATAPSMWLAAKRPKITAQGFSPGLPVKRKRPESGGRRRDVWKSRVDVGDHVDHATPGAPRLRHIVLILKYRPIVGEGSRPRDPLLSKPSAFDNCRRKYTVGFRYFLAARGTRALPELHSPRRIGDAFRALVGPNNPGLTPWAIISWGVRFG